jgi:hypothetical protein
MCSFGVINICAIFYLIIKMFSLRYVTDLFRRFSDTIMVFKTINFLVQNQSILQSYSVFSKTPKKNFASKRRLLAS